MFCRPIVKSVSVRQPPASYAMVGSSFVSVICRFLFAAMDGLIPVCVGPFGDVMTGFRLSTSCTMHRRLSLHLLHCFSCIVKPPMLFLSKLVLE
ncbi:hypothetical protein ARALYDRAFT_897651 [Arabidopsis lyrata subsp. lyrata]|uniref:Uncharacterized protein n=1 Tax=Arabidopsis lyrata subsp. lyrata TaxID=81972 RepID=D7L2A4_ARALL|nr:hypothetical protein ARALYDRAFT_897651 [Arabidopsis lyrata subsp. lyrata]